MIIFLPKSVTYMKHRSAIGSSVHYGSVSYGFESRRCFYSFGDFLCIFENFKTVKVF